MDCKDYLKFCHETYRDEFKDRDQFIPKQGFLLTGIVVLAGVVIKLATLDRIHECLTRIDVFLFYLATVGALVALGIGVLHLIRSIRPRTYEQIASLSEFDRWRESIREILKRPEFEYTDEKVESLLEQETHQAMIQRLNEALDRNFAQNRIKAKHFNNATYAVIFAVGFLAIQMLATLTYMLSHAKGP